jgi:hypothetical protein
MDTITVVVKMTGLLLVVPPKAGGPTHILMPATDLTAPHVAFVGFPADSTARHCTYYNEEDGYCIVDMAGWSLDLTGPGGGASGTPVTLPRALVNLSRGAGGRPVPPQYLSANPGRNIRSRITLRGGGPTDQCSLATWTFDPAGRAPAEILPLANVFEWTIPELVQDSLVLVRDPLDPAPGDTAQRLARLRPDSAGVVELVIAHIPTGVAMQLHASLKVSTTQQIPRAGMEEQSHMQAPEDDPPAETEATHFRWLYDLLRANQAERPLPHSPEENESCTLDTRTLSGEVLSLRTLISPETLNCMLASARNP